MGVSSSPTISARVQGTRRTRATMPMTNAATSARLVRPPEAGTHWAATVELPRQRTSSRTKAASGSVPAGGFSCVGMGLDQADSIACPQHAGEVVALPDDVQVDIRAQVEAQVGLRGAEAGGVDVEGQQRRAPAPHR